MSKPLIVFAQLSEAEVFLHDTKAKPIAEERTCVWSEGVLPCYYEFDKGWIAISGLGMHQAQMAVSKYNSCCDEIWNIGLAGALNNGLLMGELLTIQTVGKYIPIQKKMLDEGSYQCLSFTVPNFVLQENGSNLVTSDFPIHRALYKNQLALRWDLVDMEGYGVAFAAASLRKKCRIWKIVSDFASPGGRELIQKNKRQFSEKIAQKLLEMLGSQPYSRIS